MILNAAMWEYCSIRTGMLDNITTTFLQRWTYERLSATECNVMMMYGMCAVPRQAALHIRQQLTTY